MKKISKTTIAFSLMAINLVLAITPVKAEEIKNTTALFQGPKTIFIAKILDENGKEMAGATARIKGREDQAIRSGQTSEKGGGGIVMIMDYPTNAIIVVSKPGYVSQEFKTAGIPEIDPKKQNSAEYHRRTITVKMVPVKKGVTSPAVKKNK